MSYTSTVVLPPGVGLWVAGQDSQRMGRYAELLAFYNGAQWSGRARARERRLTVNYARTFVRKCVSYLFSEPVTWAVPDQAAAASSRPGARPRMQAAEASIKEISEFNDLARLDFDVAVDAGVLGDGAFKVTWDAKARLPLITPVDVTQLWAWWRPDDYRQLTRVVQAYRVLDDAATGGQVAVDGGRAAGRLVVEDWRPNRYTLTVDNQVTRDGPNPYPWIPYVIFPNEALPQEFWGVSDLTDLMGVCAELNRRLSVLAQILDYSGAPIAVLENVEGSDGVVVEPGAKWEIPADAKAYVLDMLAGGGVDLHIKSIEALYRVMHDLAETPRTAFGEGSGGAISGVALEVQLQPLIQKVKRKRAIWEGVYRRRNAMCLDLLALNGREVGTRRTVAVWPPITPRDRPQLVSDEVSLVGANIHSPQRAMEELGEENPAAEWAAVLEQARGLAATQPKPVAAPGSGTGGGHAVR